MRLPITGAINAAVFDACLRTCQPCIAGTDRELVLDLSSAEWGFPSGLVPLASLMRSLSRQGVAVSVGAYPDSSVCSYYCRMGFFARIGAHSPCRKSKRSAAAKYIEITELEHAQIEAENQTRLVRLLQNLPKEVEATEVSRASFIDACGELVSNTRHAYETRVDAGVAQRPPALLQAQLYPKRQIVELCIADCGIGIKRSMEGEHGNGNGYRSHLDAINAALAFRNRAEIGGGAGLGLAALHSYIKKNGGTLRIRSGDALKVQREGNRVTSTEELPAWVGTIVTVEIRLEKKADLSRISRRLAQSGA